MNALMPYFNRARAAFLGLTEREQKLVALLVFIVVGMLLFFVVSGQIRKTNEWRQGSIERREAISQLISRRADYAAAVLETKELNFKLDANPVSIPSFVEARSRSLSIMAPTNFRDSRQPVGGNPNVTALSTEIVFPDMTLGQLSDFAREVYLAPELLYIQRIDLKERRNAEGFEVTMQLTTYQNNRGDEEGAP